MTVDSRKPSGPTAADDVAPNPHFTLDFIQSGFCVSPLSLTQLFIWKEDIGPLINSPVFCLQQVRQVFLSSGVAWLEEWDIFSSSLELIRTLFLPRLLKFGCIIFRDVLKIVFLKPNISSLLQFRYLAIQSTYWVRTSMLQWF